MLDFANERLERLWRALSERNFEEAQALLQSGLTLDDVLEEDGNSALHDAAQEGDVEMVDFYLRQGCPRTLASFDYLENTPLIRAADAGNLEIVRKLIAAVSDVNAHHDDRIGNTAILEAVRGGHVEIVRVLLAAGADPTIPGWMMISAVDQAYHEVKVKGGLDSRIARELRRLFSRYPSPLRDRLRTSGSPIADDQSS